METEAEAVGQASTSSDIPLDAFQVILERLDGLREVQTEQSERMAAMQGQLNVLSAKFESITTHHEQSPFDHSSKKGGEVFEKQLLRGSTILRGSSQKQCLSYLFCLCLGLKYYVLDYCCFYGFGSLWLWLLSGLNS